MYSIIDVNVQLKPEGTKNVQSGFFLRAGRKSCYIEVYEGNNVKAKNNTLLYRLKISRGDFPLHEKMYMDIEITIQFDGICFVQVYIQDTNRIEKGSFQPRTHVSCNFSFFVNINII